MHSTSENSRMTAGWFLTYHEIPEVVQGWLARLGVRDPERGAATWRILTRRAGAESLADVARLAVMLDAILPRCADPGMALANLERFLAAVPRLGSTLRELAGDTGWPRSCCRSSAPASTSARC